MKKFKSTLLIVAAMLLVAVISVTATIAYLKSQTDIVENTFTVGNVKITLDEADVNEIGVLESDDRVVKNDYKLYPNRTYLKDPTVHVDANSSDAYLFVKVVVPADFASVIDSTNTIAAQMQNYGWKLLDDTQYPNVYVYTGGQNADAVDENGVAVKADKDYKVFDSFKIKPDAVNEDLEKIMATEGTTNIVKVQAYAIQTDGFASAAAAYAADPCTWGI